METKLSTLEAKIIELVEKIEHQDLQIMSLQKEWKNTTKLNIVLINNLFAINAHPNDAHQSGICVSMEREKEMRERDTKRQSARQLEKRTTI